MPKGKSRKFIDKKNSATFTLVHRSQKDPRIADEDAPQRILMPVEDSQTAKNHRKVEAKKKKEELEKFGIFYEDDYDYMQHLRPVNKAQSLEWERVENPNNNKKENEKKEEKPQINLPAIVRESEEQEEIGLLNRAIPMGLRLDLDPDIVAALDDDFDFDNSENELEDDFVSLAGGEIKSGEHDYNFDEEDEEYEDEEYEDESGSDGDSTGHMEVSDEERDDVASLYGKQFSFKDEETKSRFTEYSMSSSVIRRNENLTLLDDRFEKMFAQYDDNEIGALDCEEIEGDGDPNVDTMISHEEKTKQEQEKFQSETQDIVKLMKERMKIMDKENPNSDVEQDLDKLVVVAREREKWDCESILSTYSNIYNHPTVIKEPKGPGKIKIHSRTGIPKDVLGAGKLTAKSLAQFDLMNDTEMQRGPQSVAETMKSVVSTLSIRPKDETPEERKERKRMLKEYRRERRIERKANTEAFKEEKLRQEKILLNNRKNVQGNHIF